MTETYTCNQTGAIATILASSVWAVIALGSAITIGRQTASALTVFGILTVIAWILVPLYMKRVRPAYIVGIIVIIIALVGLLAMPGSPPWYTFTDPVYNLSFVIFYLVMIAGIYYSYKSYQELKK